MFVVPCSALRSIPASKSLNTPGSASKLVPAFARFAALAVIVVAICTAGLAQPSLQVLHNHVYPQVTNRQASLVGALPDEQQMHLSIVLPLRNQAELTSLLSRLYDPASPDYRRFLSVAEFTERFGPTVEDYQTVVSFAQENGFVVTDTSPNRLLVSIRGSVAQINSAFNLTMNVYQHPSEDRTFFSPDREPSLNLSVPVAHIAGLNNFYLPRPMLVQTRANQALANLTGSGPGGSYLGSDMRAAYYGGSTLDGTGQTVGIFEFDGYYQSDVDLTFSGAGQTYDVPINNVLLDGMTGAPIYGDDAEQVLDIVQAIGMAPGLSQVRVYIGTNDVDILNSMATENIAKELSCSWSWRPDDPASADVFFQEFATQGQSFLTASGDEGAFDVNISPFFYPQEDAYVTTVGGTHLTTNGAAGAWASEIAWNSSGAGSGGGISPDGIPLPAWQTGVANSLNAGSTTLRNVPDVAMEGDFDNFYCALGSCRNGGAGTSFASPRWAGFMALINEQAAENGKTLTGGLGFINPPIYTIGASTGYDNDFHDITAGNNDTGNQLLWFNSVAGYDLVTGWGSPTGQSLIDDLAGPQVPGFWIAGSPRTVSLNPGTSKSTTIKVTGAGGFTGNVQLAITSALPTGVTASWGTNPTSGTSVLTLTASSSAPVTTTPVTITGTSNGLAATSTITVGVHTPTFTLSAAPASVGVNQGASVTSTISVVPLYGFTGTVNLSVSGLPAGVSASWGQNPTSSTSVLTLTATSSAIPRTSTLTLTGMSGNLTVTSPLILTIQGPSFTLATAGHVDVGLNTSVSTYVWVFPQYGFSGSVSLSIAGLPSGVTASFDPNPTTGSSTLTFTSSSAAATGTSTLTITGTSGNLSATAKLTLGVHQPGFTLSGTAVNLGRGNTATSQIYMTPQYGFNSNVTLSVSGLPAGVTASFVPNPTTGSSTLSLAANSSAVPGQYSLTIAGNSGSISASTAISLAVGAPAFTLSTGGSLSLGQGSSVTSYISVSPQYGFTGSVNLSVSGLPAGVTASFAPNPTTGTGVLTLNASSSAAVGQYALTITGTSGASTATATLSLGIYTPNFTLSSYGDVSLGQGSSATTGVNVSPQYGFTGSVNLAVSGLPSGVTSSFSPNPTTGSSTLTFTAANSASVGKFTATITGTSGSLKSTTTFSLSINAQTFTLSSNGSVTLGQSSSTTTGISVNPQYGFTGSVNLTVSGLPSGVTASLAPNPTTGTSTLTLTASSSAAVGQYTLTVTGTAGALSATTTLSLSIAAPSFTLSSYGNVNLGQGKSATAAVFVNPQNGFTASVNLSVTGLPNGVTASFSPNPVTSNSTLTLTASSAAAVGQYTVTITGTSGSLKATTPLAVNVYAPTFTLNAPSSITLGQGASNTAQIYVNSQPGFTGSVSLSVAGLPGGVTALFAPNPTTQSSTLTLTAVSSAAVGQYPLTITGKSGSQTVTTAVSLTIAAPSFTIQGPSDMSLGRGSSATSYIYVNPQNGFSGNVSFSLSGLPSGVSASFLPNPTTGTSTLTATAGSSASLGQYIVTVVGTSGTQTATTTFSLGVCDPSFTLSSYGSVNITQGSSGNAFVYVNAQYGFTGAVSLAVSNLPSGVTASFSPNPTTGSTQLTLTASSSAALGQYLLIITGTSGTQTATTTLTLGVLTPTFSLSGAWSMSVGLGSSATSTIYVYGQNGFSGAVSFAISGLPGGVTASFSPNPATGSTMLTVSASSSASVGQYMVTVTGTSGAQTATTSFPLTVSPQTFTLSSYGSLTIGVGNSGSIAVTVLPQYGFAGSVRLSASGLPAGVTAYFSPNPTTGNSTLTLWASASASLSQYNVTITGTSGSQTATTSFPLTISPPAFTLSSYSNPSIGQGTSGTSYVYISSQSGFTGAVALSVSGLPSGVTASFSPNPATGTSTLTFTANSSATLGQYLVTITGTSGAQSASTTLTLSVYTPTFTLSTYSSVSIGQGTSASAYINVNPQYGFTGNVSLSVSGLPGGVTGSFSPNPTTGSSTLTLTATSSANPGQYTVRVSGTSGTQTATTSFPLTVATPSFTLSGGGNVNLGQGSSSTAYFNISPQNGFTGNVSLSVSGLPSGVTASFSPNPTTYSSTLTLTASSSAAIGQYALTVKGTSGSLTSSTPLSLSILAPSFTLTNYGATIGQGSSGTVYVYVNPQNGFTGSVNLSASGLPSGVSASFSPNPATSFSTLTLTANSSAAVGQYSFTITGTSGSLTASTTGSLVIDPQSFTLAGPGGVAINEGGSAISTVYVYPQCGFTGGVTFSASGLPSGVTAAFSPNPSANSTQLTLTASSNATPGTATVTITGTSGGMTASTTLSLTVNAPGFTLQDQPGAIVLLPSGSGKTAITVIPQNGFAGSVNLEASGLPNGVAAAFSPNPATTGTSLLTLTAGNSPATGSTTATITGTAGALVASVPLVVTVRMTPATTATTLSVTAPGISGTSVPAGTLVSLTVRVTSGGTPLTAGQVRFCDASASHCDGIHQIGRAQLTSAGTAVLKIVPEGGNHSYKAVFAGTNAEAASTSASANLTVAPSAPTTTTIAQSSSQGKYSLTATVVGQGPVLPSGAVSFLDATNGNALLGSVTLGSGQTALTTLNSPSLATGAAPTSVAIGDFNGDGIPDLAVANLNENDLTILLGNGDGSFTASASFPFTSIGPAFVAVGDFNNDNKPDLVVANSGAASLTILLGNGDGTFTLSPFSPQTGNGPRSIAIADFNGDGIQDLAVANSNDGTVTILLGNGDGTFSSGPQAPQAAWSPGAIVAGDFNGDGILDLVTAASYSGLLTVLLGNGDGTFAPVTGPGLYYGSLATGDFNGDGKLDLAVSSFNSVAILLGNGDGTFTVGATPPPTGNLAASIAVGDFNRDGNADLAVTGQSRNTVFILLGKGDGTFAAGPTPGTGAGPVSVAVGDFNADGVPDLAAVNSTDSTVSIVLSQLTQTASATADGISPAAARIQNVKASYSGDADYLPSVSNTINLGVTSTPTVTVTPSASSITTAQALSVTVTVSGGGNPVPTGSVTLSSGGFVSAATPLSGGSASVGIPAGSLAAGNQTLTATYTPDASGATNYTSATGTASVTVTNPANPLPAVGSLSPGFTTESGPPFTLTVGGSGFASGSTVYWGSTALATQFVSTSQLTAQVPASNVATAGVTAVSVQSPAPGGGTSNAFQFEVDSNGGSTPPSFTTTSTTVRAGSTATYAVTLPASATNVSAKCLNLPTGAACSYSSAPGAVNITTSSATPAGTYQITVVFTETLPGAASALVVLPIFLLPIAGARRRRATARIVLLAWLALASAAAASIGCGGGGGNGGGGNNPPPQTHQVTSSGTVTLTVQ